MGKEPKDIEKIRIKARIINYVCVNEVHIDLKHINHGLDKRTGEYNKKSRSKFSVLDVLKWIYDMEIREDFELVGEDDTHLYYAQNRTWFDGKRYRMVFCFAKGEKNMLGVITIYRIKKARGSYGTSK